MANQMFTDSQLFKLSMKNAKTTAFSPKYLRDNFKKYVKSLEYRDDSKRKRHDIATIVGFCRYANVPSGTYYAYRKLDKPQYFDLKIAIEEIEDHIEDHNLRFAARNQLNTSITQLYLKNRAGYSDRVEQEITQKGATQVKIVDDLKE